MKEATSSDLIIPLDLFQSSTMETRSTLTETEKFVNIFDILNELLGLSAPIVVKHVMLSSSEVVVKVSDEFEAKKKFISSMNEVQKALSIKKG